MIVDCGDAATVRRWFQLAAVFASNDVGTPIIESVLAEAVEGRLRLTATDKYIAARVHTELKCDGSGPHIIPLHHLTAALSVINGPSVRLTLGRHRAAWTSKVGGRYSHPLQNGTYPDVDGLLGAQDDDAEARDELILGFPLEKMSAAQQLVSAMHGPTAVTIDTLSTGTGAGRFSMARFRVGRWVTGGVMPVRP